MKRSVAASLLVMVASLLVLQGCQGACAHAEDLCVECGETPESCERLFSGADGEFCEKAVESYENNCKDVPDQ